MNRRLFRHALPEIGIQASWSATAVARWRMTAAILLAMAASLLVCTLVTAGNQMDPEAFVKRPGCLSSIVPLNRTWEEERNVDINQEFNDYAAIYLDAFSADCKAVAASTLAQKLEGTLKFAEAGGTVKTGAGLEVHPFHNWLWGAAMTHVFASALELRYNGVVLRQDLLEKTRDVFEGISDTQDPYCAVPSNGCMDDYALTASGFAWIVAYEAKAGRDPQRYVERTRELLTRMFQPMPVSGSVCYEVVGSNPFRCDGDPAGLASGRVRIIGIGHGRENPSYGLGLMTCVASASLALYLAGQPCDFNTIDPSTGLTWKQISIELLRHARRKTRSNPATFTNDCLNINDSSGPRVACSDAYDYSPNLFPLHRFYVSKLGYHFEDFSSAEFRFDSFDPNYGSRRPETMYDRSAFWGLNRFVFYNLLANEAWPGGTLNQHFKQASSSVP